MKFIGLPVRFARTPGRIQREAPEPSQHTEEVLRKLGYTWEEIRGLEGVRLLNGSVKAASRFHPMTSVRATMNTPKE